MNPETHILPNEERANDSKTVLGFWIYLMTDFVLFAGLFSVFLVLRAYNTQGPTLPADLPYALIETLILLTSSFMAGISLIAARANSVKGVILSLIATVLLGGTFLTMEISEFSRLIAQGNGPQTDGFLSSYFTLVGTHGLHIAIGLLWVIALIIAIAKYGLTKSNMRKLALWSLFWHFLDIVWIFIFTIVYLMGAI